VYLLLSGLVLVATLYNLFWLVVWDNTTDEFSIFWLFFTLPFVLLCGLFLQRRSKPSAALFVLLSLGLFAGVFALAARVDYRALTEARAGRVSQAIEAYQARTGRYPQDLGQLAPRYLLSLPGPVIINGWTGAMSRVKPATGSVTSTASTGAARSCSGISAGSGELRRIFLTCAPLRSGLSRI
jgi:hypothetical protein